MSGELATATTTQLPVITPEKITEYMNSFGLASQLNDNEKHQFIEVATAYGLNPFKREIYCVPYKTKNGRKLSLITGYEVYLKRAERTGKLNGWNADIKGSRETKDLRAVVTIWRKDWEKPFIHEAYWGEYHEDNRMWNNKPITMIRKVAIAQAFRLAFPDELGGIPYTADELPEDMTEPRDVTPETQSSKTESHPNGPENFVSDNPEEALRGLEKEGKIKKGIDPKEVSKLAREVQEKLSEKRDFIYTFAMNNKDCLDEEAIKFVNELDLIAIKHFKKTGEDPMAFMEQAQKRLSAAVGKARLDKAMKAEQAQF